MFANSLTEPLKLLLLSALSPWGVSGDGAGDDGGDGDDGDDGGDGAGGDGAGGDGAGGDGAGGDGVGKGKPKPLDTESFAKKKIAQGRKQTLGQLAKAFGVDSAEITDVDDFVATVQARLESASSSSKKTEAQVTAKTEALEKATKENERLLKEVAKLTETNQLLDAVVKSERPVKDLNYLRFYLNENFKRDEDGLYVRAGSNTPVLNKNHEDATIHDILESLAADKNAAEKIFAADSAVAVKAASSKLSRQDIQAKMQDPEFLALIKAQGLQKELDQAMTQDAIAAVINKVKVEKK